MTADSHGHVKGFPMESQVELPLNAQGKLDVGRALGLGVMSVIKDMGLKEPYVGQIALQTGEIAEERAAYLKILIMWQKHFTRHFIRRKSTTVLTVIPAIISTSISFQNIQTVTSGAALLP